MKLLIYWSTLPKYAKNLKILITFPIFEYILTIPMGNLINQELYRNQNYLCLIFDSKLIWQWKT